MKKERLHQHGANATRFRIVPRLEGVVRKRGITPRRKLPGKRDKSP